MRELITFKFINFLFKKLSVIFLMEKNVGQNRIEIDEREKIFVN